MLIIVVMICNSTNVHEKMCEVIFLTLSITLAASLVKSQSVTISFVNGPCRRQLKSYNSALIPSHMP
jgi:hypothetical protein